MTSVVRSRDGSESLLTLALESKQVSQQPHVLPCNPAVFCFFISFSSIILLLLLLLLLQLAISTCVRLHYHLHGFVFYIVIFLHFFHFFLSFPSSGS